LILTAIEAMGGMPKHYFQGVGGGPGPIGIHEMAQRAIEAGFAEGPVPRQHLSQNAEFCLVHDAWQKRTFELTPETEAIHPRVFSDVLLNRAPAYSVRGGLFDMLVESNGATYAVDYDDAAEAFDLFKRTEGIDPFSAGAVALASLKQAIYRGEVHRDDTILLNISGGGGERFMAEHETEAIAPIAVVDKEEAVRLGRSFTYSNQ
jgi:cysteate synthase